MDHINKSNRTDVRKWLQTDTTGRMRGHSVKHGDELDDAQRITYASRMDALLDSAHDIKIPVLLPPDFAAYANKVVSQMPGRAHLLILEPAVPSSQEGLFFWTIPSDLMWQQEDRRIDECGPESISSAGD